MPSSPRKVVPLPPRRSALVAASADFLQPRRRWAPISVALAASALIHLAFALVIGRGEPSPISATLRPPSLLEVAVVTTREPRPQIPANPDPKLPQTAPTRTHRVSPPAASSLPMAPTPLAREFTGQKTGATPPPTAGSAPPSPASTPADAAPPAGAFASVAYLHTPLPAYPPSARRLGHQGVVLARVLVNREGIPGEVRLAKSSGFKALDEAALEAVKGWRFVPARQGAEPVASWIEVPVRFRLEE